MDGMLGIQPASPEVSAEVPTPNRRGGGGPVIWKRLLRMFRPCREPAGPVDLFIARDDSHEFVRDFKKQWSACSEGRRDGVRALPKADDASVRPDCIQALLNQGQEAVMSMLNAAHRTAGQITDGLAVRKPDLVSRIEQATAEFRDVRLPRTEMSHTSHLLEAHGTHQEALRAFEKFREDNGLGGEKPQSTRGFLNYVLFVLTVLIVEGVLNGFAMQDASSAGIRGAAPWGAAIGAANVVLGLVCGHFARWRYHVRLVPRTSGWIVTILSGAVCMVMQCLVATWRYAATGDVDLNDALRSAGSTLWLHPWLWMSDLQCWLLALLGAVSFGWAFIEAETLTGHRYPGFAFVWKRERVTEEAMLDVLGRMDQESEDAMNAASHQLDAVVHEAAEDWREHRRGIGELQRLARAAHQAVASFSLEINELRQLYVSANRKVRGDALLPPYLLRVMCLNVDVPAYGQGNEATATWLRDRETEVAARVADAKAAMIRLRIKAIARLRHRLMEADGVPTPDEPSPPMPPADPDSNSGLRFFVEQGKDNQK